MKMVEIKYALRIIGTELYWDGRWYRHTNFECSEIPHMFSSKTVMIEKYNRYVSQSIQEDKEYARMEIIEFEISREDIGSSKINDEKGKYVGNILKKYPKDSRLPDILFTLMKRKKWKEIGYVVWIDYRDINAVVSKAREFGAHVIKLNPSWIAVEDEKTIFVIRSFAEKCEIFSLKEE